MILSLIGSMAQGQAICCDCLNTTTTPGCAADPVCDIYVCESSGACEPYCQSDPYCCATTWDSICAGEAIPVCDAGITLQPSESPSLQPSISPSLQPSISPSLQPSISPSLHPSISPTLVPTGSPFATTDDSDDSYDSDDDDSQSGESSTEAQNSMSYAHQSDRNHIEKNLRHTTKVEIDFSFSELCIITGVCTFLTVAFWVCQYCVNGK